MIIRRISWDSEFFGFNIADLQIGRRTDDLEKVNHFAKRNKIRLVQCLVKTTNVKCINALQKAGFEFADLRTTFEIKCKLPSIQVADCSIREARKDEIPLLKEIAGKVFYETSRYKHKKISRLRAKKLYSLWVEKAVLKTFDDVCYVKEHGGKIAGFVTYKQRAGKGIIGLIGIISEERGLGIGSALIQRCFLRSIEEGNDEIEVATGGSNIPALNFYFKNGFKISKIESWYYKWF